MVDNLILNGFYNGKRVLIFGGAGFIGSNLAKKFLGLGAAVTIVDGFIENTGADVENINEIKEGFVLYKSKIENLDNLKQLIENSDLIVDSMALTAHNIGLEKPFLDVELNLLSHLYIITNLKDCQNKKVIYLGSVSQYAKADVQGINKSAAEDYYRIYSEKYGFNVISLRIPKCYGENQKTKGEDIGLIGFFIRDILNNKEVEVYNSVERRENIIYVKDLVDYIIKLIPKEDKGFKFYDVAGINISIRELLGEIIKITGKGSYSVKSKDELIDLNTSLSNTIKYFKER